MGRHRIPHPNAPQLTLAPTTARPATQPRPALRHTPIAPSANHRPAHPDAHRNGGRSVLLVEDEAPVRRLAERVLAAAGWRVFAAADAEAALAALDDADPLHPDVLVTDLAMPGMDGIALIAAVRARLGRPDLPAVVASGYADEASRAELKGPGIVFMPKPYTPRELAARLAALA